MKRIVCSILSTLTLFIALSCNKSDDKTSVIASLGVSVKGTEDVIEIPKRQSKSFEVNLTSDPGPEEALIVTLGANAELVAKYNAAHGTDYQLLPAEAYDLPATPFLLPRYNKVSSLESITLKGAGCIPGEIYLLPLVANKVEGMAAYETPEDKAAYILFKMLLPDQEGEGTQDDPYILNNVNAFMKISAMLREGETVYFKLAGDIDLTGIEWESINGEGKKAALDGDGHTIRNLTAPLFAKLEGSVQNLTIDGATISATTADCGVLAGAAGIAEQPNSLVAKNVTVKNASIENTNNRVGGLIGYLYGGVIENVDVECTVSGGQQVGGFIGRMDAGTLINCSAEANVTASNYYAGGLVAYIGTATVKGCHSSGKCSNASTGYSRVGGLIGQMHGGSVENSYSTVAVDGLGHFGGGLIGVVDTQESVAISKSYATGSVTLPQTNNKAGAGALLGYIEKGTVSIENCYATGAIQARRWSSGFVGRNNTGILTIVNGYTTSDVSAIALPGASGIVLGNNGGAVSCSGFIAWNVSNWAFCYPADAVPTTGNYYGTEGTVSSQAVTLGWSTDIWDLSGDEPKLK